MKTDPNESAFPREANNYAPEFGLTKREYIATNIIKGLMDRIIVSKDIKSCSEHNRWVAGVAVVIADLLIEELNKEQT